MTLLHFLDNAFTNNNRAISGAAADTSKYCRFRNTAQLSYDSFIMHLSILSALMGFYISKGTLEQVVTFPHINKSIQQMQFFCSKFLHHDPEQWLHLDKVPLCCTTIKQTESKYYFEMVLVVKPLIVCLGPRIRCRRRYAMHSMRQS